MEGRDLHTSKKAKTSKVDRLSDLPDPIIHHILSLMETKYAVQTCILSKKWRHHWTHIHSLSFIPRDFKGAKGHEKFVRRVLQHRKPSTLFKLRFHTSTRKAVSRRFLDDVFNYAKSHNIQELDTDRSVCEFPSSFFEFQTLITLKLNVFYDQPFGFASLRTLQLYQVRIKPEDNGNHIFSSCFNLQNLLISKCFVDIDYFNISAPELVSLTISDMEYWDYFPRKISLLVISAPRLKIFNFKGPYPLKLTINEGPRLEKLSIRMYLLTGFPEENEWKQECFSDMLRIFQGFSHVKSLSLSMQYSKCCQKKLISYSHHRPK